MNPRGLFEEGTPPFMKRQIEYVSGAVEPSQIFLLAAETARHLSGLHRQRRYPAISGRFPHIVVPRPQKLPVTNRRRYFCGPWHVKIVGKLSRDSAIVLLRPRFYFRFLLPRLLLQFLSMDYSTWNGEIYQIICYGMNVKFPYLRNLDLALATDQYFDRWAWQKYSTVCQPFSKDLDVHWNK